MFDLDHAVAAWRRALEHRRAFTEDDLDEIEEHVRDHVETQVSRGVPTGEAFHAAVRRFGSPDAVEAEYAKVFWAKRRHDGTTAWAVARHGAILVSYLKVALRGLRTCRGHAFINITGMAIGLACSLLVVLFIHDEWRYDRFHEHAGRIYRLVTQTYPTEDGPDTDYAMSSRLAADQLVSDFPQVENVVRLRRWNPQIVRDDRYHEEDDVLFADSSFFEVFSFDLLEGNPATALADPYGVVLTESAARKYFGDTPAVGQTLVFNDSLTFDVRGVAADPPPYSHFTFDVLVSYETSFAISPRNPFNWINLDENYTYVLLRIGADPAPLERAIHELPMEQFGDRLTQFGYTSTLTLQQLERIYLDSDADVEIGATSDAARLRIVGMTGLFVLLIACINFMNLTTARSVERAREVGIRKVVGSQRGLLVTQFLTESVLTSLIAFVLAAGLVIAALPSFNALSGKSLSPGAVFTPMAVGIGLLFAVGVGVLAGSYPAFVLSRFRPAAVLKGPFHASRRGVRLRQGLVLVQFALSISLVAGTLVVHRQLRFMQDQHLGFDREQVLVLNTPGSELSQRPDLIRSQFGQTRGVLAVSASEIVPGRGVGQGVVYVGDQPTGRPIDLEVFAVDERFVETMGLTMAAGRSLASEDVPNPAYAALINEAAATRLGFASHEEAVGTSVVEASDMRTLTIAGVVEDYHQVSLREAIQPMVMRVKPVWYTYLSLRLAPGDLTGTMGRIEATWADLFPGHAFESFFLDEAFDRQYAGEQRLMRLFGILAGLAIVVACLGLVGLASSIASQRTKEIGIRKALGASVAGIVVLLTRGIAGPVVLALLVGGPLAYLVLDRWLADFAYRIELSWTVVLVSGALALGVALLTVSFQSIRAARGNPAKALRYE